MGSADTERRRKAVGGKKIEDVFGRKIHAMVCAKYGVPICFIVTHSKVSDNHIVPQLIEKARDMYGDSFQPEVLLGDRGYDDSKLFAYLVGEGIEPVILIRKPTAHDGLYQGTFDRKGRPVCGDGRTPMKYVRSEGASHLFTCTDEGCELRERSGLIRHCDSTEGLWFDGSKSNPKSIRAFGWRIRRASPEWAELYRMRQSVGAVLQQYQAVAPTRQGAFSQQCENRDSLGFEHLDLSRNSGGAHGGRAG